MKAEKLKKGDEIGLIAPSRFTFGFKKELDEGKKILTDLGFKIIQGKNINKRIGNSAGAIEEKVDDLHEMLRRERVKAIFCALGGDSTNQILEHIDYKLFKKYPKIILGFSDITYLLLAIYKKTGLLTFHGPNLKDLSSYNKKTISFFINLLEYSSTNKKISYPNSMNIIKDGKAKGKLIGGNLFVINSLLKTKYCPDLKDAILFFEDIDESIASIEFQLYQLRLSGILNKIAGIVIGHIETNLKKSELKKIITQITYDLNIPIIKVDYFGHHSKNFLIFPIGAKILLDTKNKEFSLLDSPLK